MTSEQTLGFERLNLGHRGADREQVKLPSTRVRELDGLRGLAIASVVAGHAWSGLEPTFRRLIPGTTSASGLAFFGVTLFFVLSGYLITSILVSERERTGTVALRRFYTRRARRLLPALALLIVGYGIYGMATGQDHGQVIGSMVRAGTYTENLGGLLHLPTTGWLSHTWSLATEEQFYLVWPLVVVAVARRGPDALATVALLGAVATAVIRGLLIMGGANPYGHLHWDALLLGCLLAVRPFDPPRWAIGLAGAAVAGQVAYYLSLDGYAPLTSIQYLLFTAASVVLVAGAPKLRFLRSGVLVHLGTISYGLYLWHVVILRAGYPVIPSVLASLVLAELSWRLIERRFLHQTPIAAAPQLVLAIAPPPTHA